MKRVSSFIFTERTDPGAALSLQGAGESHASISIFALQLMLMVRRRSRLYYACHHIHHIVAVFAPSVLSRNCLSSHLNFMLNTQLCMNFVSCLKYGSTHLNDQTFSFVCVLGGLPSLVVYTALEHTLYMPISQILSAEIKFSIFTIQKPSIPTSASYQ